MKNVTPAEFCEKFNACPEGREWAMQYPTMIEVWEAVTANAEHYEWSLWLMTREGVFSDRELRLFACWCVRNTPTHDGRTVWDLLTDTRSRRAVEVAEAYARGEATHEELAAAWDAAWDEAWDTAIDAARAAAGDPAGDAAWVAAWDAAKAAAWDSAKSFQLAHIREMPNPFDEE